MREGTPTPQINVSKIQGSGGIAGALFAVISTVIFRKRLVIHPSAAGWRCGILEG